jgi:hypothetical protein
MAKPPVPRYHWCMEPKGLYKTRKLTGGAFTARVDIGSGKTRLMSEQEYRTAKATPPFKDLPVKGKA